jgi:hypothetical protein
VVLWCSGHLLGLVWSGWLWFGSGLVLWQDQPEPSGFPDVVSAISCLALRQPISSRAWLLKRTMSVLSCTVPMLGSPDSPLLAILLKPRALWASCLPCRDSSPLRRLLCRPHAQSQTSSPRPNLQTSSGWFLISCGCSTVHLVDARNLRTMVSHACKVMKIIPKMRKSV